MDKFAKWSQEYKDSIDCSDPKGFSQRAHCQGLKKKKAPRIRCTNCIQRPLSLKNLAL